MTVKQAESHTALVDDTIAFLLQHPPFDQLQAADLEALARKTEVIYIPAPETLFEEGQASQPFCYILIKGQIEFYRHQSGELSPHLVDLADPGELFGVRAVMAGDTYLSTATVARDSLLYRLPIDGFRALAEKHSAVSWYLASDFAAGLPTQGVGMHQAHHRPTHFQDADASREKLPVQLALTSSGDILCCPPDTSVFEASRKMADINVGSILIVDEEGLPQGILTDSDLRRKVLAQGLDPAQLKVSEVMSGPVVTERHDAHYELLVVKMLERGVGHLVLTESGYNDTKPLAIVSEHDLLMAEGNHPAIILRQIHKAQDEDKLHQLQDKVTQMAGNYLQQGWALPPLARMITSLRDGIAHKSVEISAEKMGLTPHFIQHSAACWLVLGSEGRGEQMLPTDQDSAMILPESLSEPDRQRYETWSQQLSGVLEAAGYELCPAGVMSSSEKWRKHYADWQTTIDDWISTPDKQAVLEASIFFDFRALHGDHRLANSLRKWIVERLRQEPALLRNMAKEACDTPPPLSFFGNFMVEKTGGKEARFDIKRRAQLPLSDAARLLAFEAGMPQAGGTFDRYQWLAEQFPKHRELYHDAAHAYALFLKIRAQSGVAQGDGGRYVPPKSLSRLERQRLRNAFSVIDSIHRHLKLHYQLSYLG